MGNVGSFSACSQVVDKGLWDVRQQDAVELARHIEREEPLFVVQEIGRRGQDGAWALKVYDTITGRRAVVMDAGLWPRLRDAARNEQRQLLHRAFEGTVRPTQPPVRVPRHEEQVQTV